MRAFVVSIAAAHLVASPARADDTEAKALAHLERGIAAFEADEFARAQEELLAASRLAPHKPNPYRWLALVEVQLGDCRSALANIAAFVERVPADDPRLAELVRLRELCERTGALHVRSSPTGAALRIDGSVVGTTPYRSLSMRAGTYRLALDKRGFREATRSVVITAGSEADVVVELARAETPLTKRWWFWPAVAGVTLAAAGAVVYFASDGDDVVLPPVHCDNAGCSPGMP